MKRACSKFYYPWKMINSEQHVTIEKQYKHMKWSYILAVFCMFIGSLCFSQQMPIDFSNNSDVFSVWGGSMFATRLSPTDSSNTIGEFSRSNSSSE